MSDALLNQFAQEFLTSTPNAEAQREFIKKLFNEHTAADDLAQDSSQTHRTHQTYQTTIVGGGPAGMLLALRLSKDSNRANDMCLIDIMPQLGGRTFFSSPENLAGMRASERFLHAIDNVKKGVHLSGFGFECYTATSLEIFERHLRAQLTDEEGHFLDQFLTSVASTKQSDLTHSAYVVRKEFTSLAQLVLGSSETLTKHEADVLHILFKRDVSEFEGKDLKSFNESTIWRELSKNRREALTPFLETVLCDAFPKMMERDVVDMLSQLWASHSRAKTSSLFTRASGVEFALELILRCRGVKMMLSTEVTRVTKIENDNSYRLMLANEIDPLNRELFTKRVCLAIPLSRSLTLIPREWLTPAQSRFTAKVRPKSVVVSEFLNFKSVVTDQWPSGAGSGTPLIFPVERARGVVTSVGSLVFFTTLDFEESIHAPSVREALARVRRAASRVVRPEALKDLEPSLRIPNQHAKAERVVLLPVGYSVPFEHGESGLTDVEAAAKGLFFCGDSFGFGFAPWMNVVNSVQAVASILLKVKS